MVSSGRAPSLSPHHAGASAVPPGSRHAGEGPRYLPGPCKDWSSGLPQGQRRLQLDLGTACQAPACSLPPVLSPSLTTFHDKTTHKDDGSGDSPVKPQCLNISTSIQPTTGWETSLLLQGSSPWLGVTSWARGSLVLVFCPLRCPESKAVHTEPG